MYRPNGTLSRKIHDVVVKPNLDKIKDPVHGKLLYYNDGKASISAVVDGITITYHNLKVIPESGGFIPATPKPGDAVILAFNNGTVPYIASIMSSVPFDRRKVHYGPQLPRTFGVMV